MSLAETQHRPDVSDPFTGGPDLPEDPWTVLWRRKLIILAATVVAAGGAFGVAQIVPERYESSSSVRVVVPAGGTSDPEGAVNASNELASQYAQLADSAPVIERARRTEGATGLSGGDVSAGTVDEQNLIRLSVAADTPDQSRRRANALSKALTAYVDGVNAEQASRFEDIVRERLRPLDKQVRALQDQLRGPAPRSVAGQEAAAQRRNNLSSLLSERARARVEIAAGVSSASPTVQVLAQAGPGDKSQPKPVLYVAGAALVAMLLTAQLCLLAARRRSA